MKKFHPLLAGLVLTLFTTASNAIPVTPDVANFTISVNDTLRLASFTNTSTLGNEPGDRKAFWNFGDGTGTMTRPLANTQHQYQHPGAYNVCLRIYRYNSSGDSVLSAMICKTLVIAHICRADFEKMAPTAGTVLTIFKAFPWSNGNPRPYRICWQFGDGRDTCINYPNSYTGQYLVGHTYNHPGNYEVCVNIYYDGNCSARKCKMIQIGNPDSCGADFERIMTNASPLHNYFKAIPSNSNNRKPSRVCWRFGDGRDTCINYAETYTGLYAVSHIYNQPGTYEVCVRINYYGGCEASKCRNIIIAGPDSCAANFERVPYPNSSPLQAVYRALPFHNNNKKPARICWQFGDGHDTCINYTASYTGAYLVSHRYAQPGNYNVCVNIRYYGGCEASKCRMIAIPPPQRCEVEIAEITPTPASLLRYLIATPHSFATPPAPPVQICWRFGDGRDTCINLDTTLPPRVNYPISHRYPGPGIYNACVRVVFRGGCVAENCREVRIAATNTGPRLNLSPNPAHYEIHAEFLSIRTEQVMIRIVNSSGIPVRTYMRNVVVGINNWTDNITNLQPGLYTYVVQSPYQFVSKTFLKY